MVGQWDLESMFILRPWDLMWLVLGGFGFAWDLLPLSCFLFFLLKWECLTHPCLNTSLWKHVTCLISQVWRWRESQSGNELRLLKLLRWDECVLHLRETGIFKRVQGQSSMVWTVLPNSCWNLISTVMVLGIDSVVGLPPSPGKCKALQKGRWCVGQQSSTRARHKRKALARR